MCRPREHPAGRSDPCAHQNRGIIDHRRGAGAIRKPRTGRARPVRTLHPRRPNTREHLDNLAGVIGDIPRHRLEDAISAGILLEAGILSGLVFRLGGFQPGQEAAALNDATIYPHAPERGYTVLTRNIRDFDLMNQITPSGRVVFYRTL